MKTEITTAEFATVLAEWRARHGFTDAEAAAAMGCSYGAFRGWLSQRGLPHPLAMAGVLRQIRDGLNPMMQVRMTSSELATRLKEWRAVHRLNQHQAAFVLDLSKEAVRAWESATQEVYQPMLGEMLIRLNTSVSEATLTAARKRVRPVEPEEVARRLRAWRRKHKAQPRAGCPCADRTGLLHHGSHDLGVGDGPNAAQPPEGPSGKTGASAAGVCETEGCATPGTPPLSEAAARMAQTAGPQPRRCLQSLGRVRGSRQDFPMGERQETAAP